jgi:general secretion pathway protein H
MRISGTGIRTALSRVRRGAGFTLLEILVVVAIVGIVSALAAVNLFPSDEEVARRETGLLALAIEGARDEAWFGGRPVALSIEEARVRQWRLTGERTWEPDLAREKALAEGLRVTGLYVDGETLPPGTRLVFLPDGFGVPFRIALELRGLSRAIEGDAAGAVRVTP